MICTACSRPISEPEVAHQAHEDDCPRLVFGVCSCDLEVCAQCCTECEPGPLGWTYCCRCRQATEMVHGRPMHVRSRTRRCDPRDLRVPA